MIYQLRNLQSRAATAENPSALPGQGGTAGDGLKGAPAIKDFKAGATATLLDTSGPGCVRHIWLTPHDRSPEALRSLVLRMYWEGSETPSVEAPLGDFFGVAHGAAVPLETEFVVMQEGRGFNCYFPMPFAQHARITLTNELERPVDWLFYQVDFTLGDELHDDSGRFHALYRQESPCPLGHDFTLLETGGGPGVYLGCVFGVRALSEGWWGEGEVKIFLDQDAHFPTICGTGAEDYIGSAWGLGEHYTRYQGAPLHQPPFTSMYRFHVPDPIYFQERIRVTVQQMGADLRSKLLPRYGDSLIFNPKNHPRRNPEDGFYLRSDDWCATAFWYQYPLRNAWPSIPTRAERCAHLFEPKPPTKNVDL